jgi:hypothetical protein
MTKPYHLKCTRCGYEWLRRDLEKLPGTCANKECKSPNWNKPMKEKVK